MIQLSEIAVLGSDIAVSGDEPLYRPPPRRDLLRAPLLGLSLIHI